MTVSAELNLLPCLFDKTSVVPTSYIERGFRMKVKSEFGLVPLLGLINTTLSKEKVSVSCL